ncbi:MAG: thiamine pyrophosphate-binding protein [Chloroflexi bacterium]|nr:thiamine pyrophosphate-binding protein [Chloroflexota bacterium]
MTVMRGADAVVQTLKANDVKLVISYVGHTVQEIGDALYDEKGIRSFHPRSEMAGAYMVNGYNKVAGRAAAIGLWHTCGSLVASVGVFDAMTDSVPTVSIMANVHSRLKDRNAMQEMPNVDIFKPICKWATRVEKPDKIPEALHKAFQIAQSGRMGPTVIDLPFDLCVDKADMTIPPGWSPPAMAITGPADAIKQAGDLLMSAKKPVIIAGGGTVTSGAGAELKELAELLGIPVATSTTGKGVLSEDHPLSLGVTGTVGWKVANEYIPQADVVLALGYRFAEWSYSQEYAADLPGKLIHVDIDPTEIGRFYIPTVGIMADSKSFLRALLDYLSTKVERKAFQERAAYAGIKRVRDEWLAVSEEREASDQKPMSPWRVVKEIRAALAPDDILVTDTGSNTAWFIQGYRAYLPKSTILPLGLGPLGAGFPYALGAKLAAGNRRVVCGTGDGGFQYCLPDLATAVKERIPITVVVFDDGYLGANRGIAEYLFDARYQWVELNNPDFAALAKAYGADGEKVEDPRDLASALQRAAKTEVPYIIDARIDYKFTYPVTGNWQLRWEPTVWAKDPVGIKYPQNFAKD